MGILTITGLIFNSLRDGGITFQQILMSLFLLGIIILLVIAVYFSAEYIQYILGVVVSVKNIAFILYYKNLSIEDKQEAGSYIFPFIIELHIVSQGSNFLFKILFQIAQIYLLYFGIYNKPATSLFGMSIFLFFYQWGTYKQDKDHRLQFLYKEQICYFKKESNIIYNSINDQHSSAILQLKFDNRNCSGKVKFANNQFTQDFYISCTKQKTSPLTKTKNKDKKEIKREFEECVKKWLKKLYIKKQSSNSAKNYFRNSSIHNSLYALLLRKVSSLEEEQEARMQIDLKNKSFADRIKSCFFNLCKRNKDLYNNEIAIIPYKQLLQINDQNNESFQIQKCTILYTNDIFNQYRVFIQLNKVVKNIQTMNCAQQLGLLNYCQLESLNQQQIQEILLSQKIKDTPENKSNNHLLNAWISQLGYALYVETRQRQMNMANSTPFVIQNAVFTQFNLHEQISNIIQLDQSQNYNQEIQRDIDGNQINNQQNHQSSTPIEENNIITEYQSFLACIYFSIQYLKILNTMQRKQNSIDDYNQSKILESNQYKSISLNQNNIQANTKQSHQSLTINNIQYQIVIEQNDKTQKNQKPTHKRKVSQFNFPDFQICTIKLFIKAEPQDKTLSVNDDIGFTFQNQPNQYKLTDKLHMYKQITELMLQTLGPSDKIKSGQNDEGEIFIQFEIYKDLSQIKQMLTPKLHNSPLKRNNQQPRSNTYFSKTTFESNYRSPSNMISNISLKSYTNNHFPILQSHLTLPKQNNYDINSEQDLQIDSFLIDIPSEANIILDNMIPF